MISIINDIIHENLLYTNLLAHIVIFMGSLYVAVCNNYLPKWILTPLWYTGLCSLFVGISIIIQMIVGRDHPLSYSNLGVMGETLLNITIATIVITMFIKTISHKPKK